MNPNTKFPIKTNQISFSHLPLKKDSKKSDNQKDKKERKPHLPIGDEKQSNPQKEKTLWSWTYIFIYR